MKKILIVDDHPSIRTAIRIHLESIIGIGDIAEADNGQIALDHMRHDHFSLIIVDLDMPRISGLDLIHRIRSLSPDSRILVLSAQNQDIYASRAMEAGANGFISKTSEVCHITRAIEMVLSGFTCFPVTSTDAPGAHQHRPHTAQSAVLTNKELAILRYLASGFSNKDISEKLFISNKTVSTHKTRIMDKLHAGTLVELIDYARAHNLLGICP